MLSVGLLVQTTIGLLDVIDAIVFLGKETITETGTSFVVALGKGKAQCLFLYWETHDDI
jgi:hypothetical protein